MWTRLGKGCWNYQRIIRNWLAKPTIAEYFLSYTRFSSPIVGTRPHKASRNSFRKAKREDIVKEHKNGTADRGDCYQEE
jgi:hypothetical protein